MFLWALCLLRNPLVKHELEIVMKSLNRYSKQRGFTLIEVGIALAIGLVIILGVTATIQATQKKAILHGAITSIQTIMAAATDYSIVNSSYKDIINQSLIDSGYDIADGYVVKVGTTTGEYIIELPPFSPDVQTDLDARFANQFTPDTTKETIEYIFPKQ